MLGRDTTNDSENHNIDLILSSQVSYAGHLGGAVTGFLISFVVLKKFGEHPWHEKLQKVCVGILAGIFIIILVVNISVGSLYLPTEWNFNYRKSLKNYLKNLLMENPEELLIRWHHNSTLESNLMLFHYNVSEPIKNSYF